MLAETTTGPNVLADGAQKPLRSDKQGALVATDAHGRYHEAVYRGNVFFAANQAGAAVTNLATTATGFILTNPAGSGKILSVLSIGFLQTSTAAAAVTQIAIAANVNTVAAAVTQTTPLTVRNALLGSSSLGTGLAASAATLPAAPVVIRSLWVPSVSATATTAVPPMVRDDVAGLIMLAPGTAISLTAFAAVSGIADMVWEEIPV